MTTPVFTWTPFYTPKISYGYKVLKDTFENGTEQRRLKRREPTKWTLTFKTTYAEMCAIRDFYVARSGSYEAFNYTDPYSNTIKSVRFNSDTLDIESEFLKNGIFEIELVEVL